MVISHILSPIAHIEPPNSAEVFAEAIDRNLPGIDKLSEVNGLEVEPIE